MVASIAKKIKIYGLTRWDKSDIFTPRNGHFQMLAHALIAVPDLFERPVAAKQPLLSFSQRRAGFHEIHGLDV